MRITILPLKSESATIDVDVLRRNRIRTKVMLKEKVKQVAQCGYEFSTMDANETLLTFNFVRGVVINGISHTIRVSAFLETAIVHNGRDIGQVGSYGKGLCKVHLYDKGSWVSFGIPNKRYDKYDCTSMIDALVSAMNIEDAELISHLTTQPRMESLSAKDHMGVTNIVRNILKAARKQGGFTGNSCHARSAAFIRKYGEDHGDKTLNLTESTGLGIVEHSFITDGHKVISDTFKDGRYNSQKHTYTTSESSWTYLVKYRYHIKDIINLELGDNLGKELEKLNLLK